MSFFVLNALDTLQSCTVQNWTNHTPKSWHVSDLCSVCWFSFWFLSQSCSFNYDVDGIRNSRRIQTKKNCMKCVFNTYGTIDNKNTLLMASSWLNSFLSVCKLFSWINICLYYFFCFLSLIHFILDTKQILSNVYNVLNSSFKWRIQRIDWVN